MNESNCPSLSKRMWKRLTSWRFFCVSILVHLLFALVAVVLVVQVINPKRRIVFTPSPPAKEPELHELKLAQKQRSMSAPAPMRQIVTTGLSNIALPELPSMPSMEPSMPASMAGMGGPGLGLASGTTMGSSDGGGGGIPFFGMRTGGGFKGTFYDLKQFGARRPTGMNPDKYSNEVRHFVLSGWNESIFSRYFKAPAPLYTRQIFVPFIWASEGPKAFGLEELVKPMLYVVIYKATVIPSYSGNVRFVGKGDDLMIVRFDDHVVLDWGQPDAGKLSDWKPHNKAYMYPFTNGMGVMPGDWIDVQAGRSYPMEVLIGERPGGTSSAYLFIEKQNGRYTKDDKGDPILPVFRLAGGADFKLPPNAEAPPFASNDEPWKAVNSGADDSSLLGQGLLP